MYSGDSSGRETDALLEKGSFNGTGNNEYGEGQDVVTGGRSTVRIREGMPPAVGAEKGVPRGVVILVVVFLDLFAVGMAMPLVTPLIKELGASPLQVGFLSSTYGAVQLVTGPFFGLLSDSMGRRVVIMVSYAGAGASYLLLGQSSTVTMVVISRVLLGITKHSMNAVKAYVADHTTASNRAVELGRMATASALGIMVGPAVGGMLFKAGSYPLPTAAAALLYAINSFITVTQLEAQHKPSAESTSHGHKRTRVLSLQGLLPNVAILTRPRVAALMAVRAVLGLAVHLFRQGFSLLLIYRLNLPVHTNGLLLSLQGFSLLLIYRLNLPVHTNGLLLSLQGFSLLLIYRLNLPVHTNGLLLSLQGFSLLLIYRLNLPVHTNGLLLSLHGFSLLLIYRLNLPVHTNGLLLSLQYIYLFRQGFSLLLIYRLNLPVHTNGLVSSRRSCRASPSVPCCTDLQSPSFQPVKSDSMSLSFYAHLTGSPHIAGTGPGHPPFAAPLPVGLHPANLIRPSFSSPSPPPCSYPHLSGSPHIARAGPRHPPLTAPLPRGASHLPRPAAALPHPRPARCCPQPCKPFPLVPCCLPPPHLLSTVLHLLLLSLTLALLAAAPSLVSPVPPCAMLSAPTSSSVNRPSPAAALPHPRPARCCPQPCKPFPLVPCCLPPPHLLSTVLHLLLLSLTLALLAAAPSLVSPVPPCAMLSAPTSSSVNRPSPAAALTHPRPARCCPQPCKPFPRVPCCLPPPHLLSTVLHLLLLSLTLALLAAAPSLVSRSPVCHAVCLRPIFCQLSFTLALLAAAPSLHSSLYHALCLCLLYCLTLTPLAAAPSLERKLGRFNCQVLVATRDVRHHALSSPVSLLPSLFSRLSSPVSLLPSLFSRLSSPRGSAAGPIRRHHVGLPSAHWLITKRCMLLVLSIPLSPLHSLTSLPAALCPALYHPIPSPQVGQLLGLSDAIMSACRVLGPSAAGLLSSQFGYHAPVAVSSITAATAAHINSGGDFPGASKITSVGFLGAPSLLPLQLTLIPVLAVIAATAALLFHLLVLRRHHPASAANPLLLPHLCSTSLSLSSLHLLPASAVIAANAALLFHLLVLRRHHPASAATGILSKGHLA
ncbi:unnamed protein product [Closterium sp. Naga37s-1]|nr:unnamed protein product [Closterium sp. Naga37s-1]